MKEHGGAMEFSSELGKGTCVKLKFHVPKPVAPANP